MDHPGPIATWLVARPLSLLTGRPAWATLVGFWLLQGVAIGLIGWLGWRHLDLHKTLFWFGVLSLGYIATGPWIYLEPWNPHVAFPLLRRSLATSRGRTHQARLAVLPWWVLAVRGSVVQTDSVTAPAVVVAAALWARRWSVSYRPMGEPGSPTSRSSGLRSCLRSSGCQSYSSPSFTFRGATSRSIGNHQALHPSDPHHGLLSSLRLFASNFRGLPVWLGGADPASPIDGGLLESSLGWLLLPVAAVVAWPGRA